MKTRHTGKIIILFLLKIISSFGSNVELLLRENLDYNKAGLYAVLYSLTDIVASSLLAMVVPLICWLIKGKRLSHKNGIILCLLNSIVVLIFSGILYEFSNILVIGGIDAVIYFFINKWLFVNGKDERKRNEGSKMSLSSPDKNYSPENDGGIYGSDIRLIQDVDNIKASEHTDNTGYSNSVKKSVDNKGTVRYCSLCGGIINNNTRKCSRCGKQYFRGISWKTIGLIFGILILACSLVLNILLYKNHNELTDNIKALEHQGNVIEDLEMENRQLEKEVQELEEKNKTLKKTNQTLESKFEDAQNQIDFFDEFVVFVEDDGTNLYHKYECNKFIASYFWGDRRKFCVNDKV